MVYKGPCGLAPVSPSKSIFYQSLCLCHAGIFQVSDHAGDLEGCLTSVHSAQYTLPFTLGLANPSFFFSLKPTLIERLVPCANDVLPPPHGTIHISCISVIIFYSKYFCADLLVWCLFPWLDYGLLRGQVCQCSLYMQSLAQCLAHSRYWICNFCGCILIRPENINNAYPILKRSSQMGDKIMKYIWLCSVSSNFLVLEPSSTLPFSY